ncbi:sulfotransferase family protein [Janibacter corallicola]|uniref:sulfotransferase family protein n=1 Tax=Janibacter corallicola TaxID=415212 RepID=UPI00082F3003|nr:sulfotransferase [Janibacter corallicola]
MTGPDGADGQHLVFIGGLHRSGTTALGRILADHPDVSGLSGTGVREDEGQHLQRVYEPAETWGGPGRFARSPRAHLTESDAVDPAAARHSLLCAWRPFWDTTRPWLVEKSPPNLVMGRYLQTVFPGSSLIVITRHPVVVALSTSKWSRRSTLTSLVDHWFTAHALLREDAPYLQRLLVLRYESLIADPRSTLAEVSSFLGLDGTLSSERIQSTRSSSYVKAWEAMATGNPWQRYQRRTIEQRFAARAESHGYDVSDLEHPPEPSRLGGTGGLP